MTAKLCEVVCDASWNEIHIRSSAARLATAGKQCRRPNKVGPDVIVLDFQMPEMNGLHAARSIHEQSPRASILMLSAHMSPQLTEEARTVGIRGVCAKSNVFSVVEAVQTLLDNRTYF